MRAKRTREDWAALIRQVEGSGESPRAFCAKRRIRLKTFEWWRWQLRRQGTLEKTGGRGKHASAKSRSPVRLIPVVVSGPTTPTSTHLELAIGNVAVRVEIGTSVAYVGELVAELRTRC